MWAVCLVWFIWGLHPSWLVSANMEGLFVVFLFLLFIFGFVYAPVELTYFILLVFLENLIFVSALYLDFLKWAVCYFFFLSIWLVRTWLFC